MTPMRSSRCLANSGMSRAAEAGRVLASYGRGSGHVFNLGHGISQYTPPDNVLALAEAVHALSRPYH